MAVHEGLLYIGTANDLANQGNQGQIWATDGASFWPVVEDGFGNPENTGIMAMASFNGWLYAGTANRAEGFEIWKLAGPGADAPMRVISDGGPSPKNEWAGTAHVFQNTLYFGTQCNPISNIAKNCCRPQFHIWIWFRLQPLAQHIHLGDGNP
jgi:hypothetical protein